MEKTQIVLSSEEREELKQFISKGVRSVRLVNRAKIILALDTSEGRKAETQASIVERVGVCRSAVNIAKRDFLEAESVSAFLKRKKRLTPPIPPKITGDVQAKIIAIACSKPPCGFANWTLQLIADRCVELKFIDGISRSSVGRVLKKTLLNLS